jgi:PAS domain S-box-containing protein
LPLAALEITGHSEFFRSIPLALLLLAFVTIALYGGVAEVLVGCVVGMLGRIYLASASLPRRPFDLGFAMIVALAVLICYVNRVRRSSAYRLEETLAALQERTVALTEAQQASRCASWTYDSTDTTRWHPGGFEVFGIPFSQLEALASPVLLIHPEDADRVREATRRMVATRGALEVEYRVVFPNGELHWCEARGTPLPGKPTLWRGVTFDITERKMTESALVRSEKLAAMGRLASTVAHEINNPLEAVTNLLYLARGDETLGETTRGYLETAEAELARLGDITRLTLGFVRGHPNSGPIDVATVLSDTLAIFRHRCAMKGIAVEQRTERGIQVNMPAHELRQIATNLISNATDALSGSDCRIAIRSFRQTSPQSGREMAVLLFQDNGIGIPAENLSRVFEPFFSTKEDVGTGIGLWVTRELVDKHGGSLSVVSGELPAGMRTQFRVELPVCSSAAAVEEKYPKIEPATS